jgi:hemerythrin-like domain-containing protein
MANTGKTIILQADPIQPRRNFLKKGLIFSAITGTGGFGLISGCNHEEEEEISPAEDLMREHGVLNRIMLIYDNCQARLADNEPFPPEALKSAAEILKTFIEGYHEKLEEDFLFTRFAKADKLMALVQLLYIQHNAGRKITDQVLQLANTDSLKDTGESQKMIRLLHDFNRMYRPHEAREDTVLFPALRKIMSKKEYYSMGKDFEKKEHELFGEDGFETIVTRVEDIEKQLGINDLWQFTPTTPK